MAEEAHGEGRPLRWPRVAAYVLAIAAWLFFSIPRRGSEGTAYWLGQITGAALIALSIAVLIRLIYWQVKGRKPRFWTPLIFVLAAVLALLVNVNMRVQDEAQREDKASALVAETSGSRSEDVKECVEGALERAETGSAEPAHLGLSKPEFELFIVRYCREVERRRLFSPPMTRQQVLRVMNDVATAMAARGELPVGTRFG